MEDDPDPDRITRGEYESAKDYTERLAMGVSRLAAAERRCAIVVKGWTRAVGELAANRRAEELVRAKGPTIASESAFIRQHNAISKLVAERLVIGPGADSALVLCLAGALDMKVPDKWLASQE